MASDMETVYLETTVISYLVARLSRDLKVAAHQQTTQEWWFTRKDQFNCYVSQVVLDEVSAGDAAEIAKRITAVQDLPVLANNNDSQELTKRILSTGVIPPRAVQDAGHIAVAAVHEIDYLLTWNCKHLANAQITRKIERLCGDLGFRLPIICTPEELMGGLDHE